MLGRFFDISPGVCECSWRALATVRLNDSVHNQQSSLPSICEWRKWKQRTDNVVSLVRGLHNMGADWGEGKGVCLRISIYRERTKCFHFFSLSLENIRPFDGDAVVL